MQEQGEHRIKRLVFAMECADQAAAFAARSRLFAMVDDAVVPALDEALSAYAHDRRLHRIDRIEIDLGRLTLEHLDARRLRARSSTKCRVACAHCRRRPYRQSRLPRPWRTRSRLS